ncbi:myb-related transcription factor, partner of profilin-like [Pleurodeles waltl]|uniref:myb-related transcription factor, partner of profilin-like n=1 Tax=Pleurodeles waltl TaxID=8319 RepID=UPI00370940C2
MASAANGKEKGERKKKLNFSEQELEVLTEEVVRSHDRLFGKSSHQVPESEKQKLWADFQTKICAVGVAQRSVEEIRKRWYDLRSRAKERVASRLEEARSTGGGPATQTPSTAMEDLVESTLLPKAVSGVTDIDTSGTPSTSKDGPAAADCAIVGDAETQPPSDSNTSESLSIAPIRRRARVLPLPDLSLDSDDMRDEGHTPSPETRSTVRQQSLPQRYSTPCRRPHDAGPQHTELLFVTVHRLYRCHKIITRLIIQQIRHLASQCQVVQHTACHDDLAHLLR